MNQTSTTDPSAQQQEEAQPAAPLRKLNPNPKQAYRITLKIENAPGPFASVEGVAQYDVENDATCGQINPHSGTAGRITSNETFELRKVSDTEYQGTIYTDLLLDEDYYGRGVCRWELTHVRAELRATGAKEETEFLPDMEDDQVLAQQAVTKYFWSGYYPRAQKSDNYPEFGDKNLNDVPDDKRNEFFTLTLSAAEVQP